MSSAKDKPPRRKPLAELQTPFQPPVRRSSASATPQTDLNVAKLKLPRQPLTEALPEPSASLIQIAVMLPRPTLVMLQSEAAIYGWRKSSFLEALLMHKLSMGIRLDRRSDAPKYRFSDDDWKDAHRWIWYLRPDLKKGFDQLRMRAGNIPARAWVILAVNEWVGLPTGFGAGA